MEKASQIGFGLVIGSFILGMASFVAYWYLVLLELSKQPEQPEQPPPFYQDPILYFWIGISLLFGGTFIGGFLQLFGGDYDSSRKTFMTILIISIVGLILQQFRYLTIDIMNLLFFSMMGSLSMWAIVSLIEPSDNVSIDVQQTIANFVNRLPKQIGLTNDERRMLTFMLANDPMGSQIINQMKQNPMKGRRQLLNFAIKKNLAPDKIRSFIDIQKAKATSLREAKQQELQRARDKITEARRERELKQRRRKVTIQPGDTAAQTAASAAVRV